MSLKATVESLDNVEEALKPFYAETTDGKFSLAVEGITTHPDVAALSNAYERTKETITSLKSEVANAQGNAANVPDDFDPEVWEKVKSGKVDQAQLEAARTEVRTKMEAEVAEWKGKYETQQADMRKATVTSKLTGALSAIGVTDPGLLEGARASMESKIQYNDNGEAYLDVGLGPMSIEQHVERWAKDAGKSFITKAKGADTKGNDGGSTTIPQKRSEMSPAQMNEYIEAHGQPAYLSLPK